MSRILLADDSPHAQRMGERILREEGYEVVSVTDGHTALMRLADVDPDLMIVDVFLPGKDGFELCSYAKRQAAHQHVRVIMTAGMLEAFDEDAARRAGADAIIKKPFEASVVIETIKPLIADAHAARQAPAQAPAAAAAVVEVTPAPAIAVETVVAPVQPAAQPRATEELDPELVRAAVTLALDEALPSLVDQITERVLSTMRNNH
jgi:DNA-binding response OmpR family regulator